MKFLERTQLVDEFIIGARLPNYVGDDQNIQNIQNPENTKPESLVLRAGRSYCWKVVFRVALGGLPHLEVFLSSRKLL